MPIVTKIVNGVRRRVFINRKGQWKFLKGKPKSKSNPKRRGTRFGKIKLIKTRTMARKKNSTRRRGMFGALQRPLVAGITYAFIQPFFSQFLTRFNIGIQDELVQILAAVVIKGTIRNKIVNNWANAAIIINTASLASGFASKILPSIGSTTNTSTVASVSIVG